MALRRAKVLAPHSSQSAVGTSYLLVPPGRPWAPFPVCQHLSQMSVECYSRCNRGAPACSAGCGGMWRRVKTSASCARGSAGCCIPGSRLTLGGRSRDAFVVSLEPVEATAACCALRCRRKKGSALHGTSPETDKRCSGRDKVRESTPAWRFFEGAPRADSRSCLERGSFSCLVTC